MRKQEKVNSPKNKILEKFRDFNMYDFIHNFIFDSDSHKKWIFKVRKSFSIIKFILLLILWFQQPDFIFNYIWSF